MKEYFRNLSMRKSMAMYGVISALFVTLMGILSLFTMDRLRIGGNNYNDIIFSKELQLDVASPNLHIIDAFAMSMEYAYIKDPSRREELRSKIARAKELYDTSYAYWKENLEEGSELYQLLIEESHKHVEAFFKVFYTNLDEAVQNENEVMVDAYVAVLIDRYNDHHDILEQVVTQVNEMADNIYSSSVKDSRNSVYIFVGLWAAMITAGVILIKALSNIIVTQATYVQSVVAEIANGNLTVEVDQNYETKNELGLLVTSVKAMAGQLIHYITYINEITSVLTHMADGHMQVSLVNEYTGEFAKVKDALYKISTSLNSTLSSINDSAQRVAEGSNDVAESATTLSEGAADQASAIEELTASIIEISEKVDGNANSAEAAGTKITEVAEYMKECNGRMMELLHAMDDIYNSSHEIDQITKTMESIASQTNLLALNASIEAARAGESGKGFAVVAGEVGNLAAESADAAKHTAELIQATIEIVKKGTVLAKDTAEGLDGVVAGSDQIVSIMDTIVIGSKDQSMSLQQFSKGIEQISIVVDSNSETAMESASASDSLKEEAYHLKELVNQFELFEIK